MASHLTFWYTGTTESGLTKLWTVIGETGAHLGYVKWEAGWRQYVFKVGAGLFIFDETCLREIADFVAAETKKHKGKL